MANLEFCDKHNMVAYLKKPTVSEGFQEIVDFINGIHIRRHLQLSDVDDISVLPTTEIFDQLSLMGKPIPNVPDDDVYEEWDDKVERDTTTTASLDEEQPSGCSPRCQEAMGGSTAQTRSKRVPTPPRDSPLPRVNILGSDEGSMTLQELVILCTTLSKKVESLEADLKQTKQVYGATYTKLIMKVKKLEKTVKTSHSRRRAKIGEDQPEDQLGVLSAAKVLADATKTNVHTYTRRIRAVSTGSGRISTTSRLFSIAEESVSTAGASSWYGSRS
ncbi:hypothetical protein Tco_0854871 [Tanacetum coccineum]